MKNPADGAIAEQSGTIKIIGIGQSLRGDDSAGLAAVRLWQEIYQGKAQQQNVQVELAELPGIGLLSLLKDARAAILVDAVITGAKPGTVHVLSENQLEAFKDGAGSAHGWGVAETLSLGRKLMPSAIPENLILIGIEARQVNLGEALSPEVELVLPEVARLIEQYVNAEPPQPEGHSTSPRSSAR